MRPIRTSRNNKPCLQMETTKLVKLIFFLSVGLTFFQISKFHSLGITTDNEDLLIAPVLSHQKSSRPDVEERRSTSEASSTPDLVHTTTKKIALENAKSTTPTEHAKTTPNSISSLSKVRDECFSLNSDRWISGNIASNNAVNITSELLDVLIEGPKNFLKLPSLFDETICHEDSPLRNFSPHNQVESSALSLMESADEWYNRFLYLALHWKFHQPALEEHKIRKRCAKNDEMLLKSFMDHHKIQAMDFECPGSKFIVIPMGNIGFGAYLNTMVSTGILLALRTNRIPIFSSKSFFPWQKRKGDQDPWLLAPTHCEHKDLQCYFLPMSPCAVTNEELEAAPIYGSTGKEQRFIATRLAIPPELESSRVVVLNSGLQFKSDETLELRQIASTVVKELLDEWKKSKNDDRILEAMDLAFEWLNEKMKDDPKGLLRQVKVYTLRPNPHYKDLLDRQISELVPRNINPSETIGLAIRGSDKCGGESMCYPFDRYMELATDIAYPTLSHSSTNIRPKLIMTTEDPQVFNNSLAYQHNNAFPFEFLVNGDDNMQGSGHPKDFRGEGENTIVSSLTAVKFHFYAGRVYLNCCSNFHMIIADLLGGQCGASRHRHNFTSHNESTGQIWGTNLVNCMTQDTVPRKFRICCSWSKDTTCLDMMKEYKQEKAAKPG